MSHKDKSTNSVNETAIEIINTLFNISLTYKYTFSEVFHAFMHLLFIHAIEKLNLTDRTEDKLHYSWRKLIDSSDVKHYIFYKVVPFFIESHDQNIRQYFQGVHRSIDMIDQRMLLQLCSLVDKINIVSMDNNQRYKFIESILDQVAEKVGKQGDVLGARTPKKIRTFITDLLDPKVSESVADLTCGTGSFLLDAAAYVDKSFKLIDKSYCGTDINSQMTEIAIMHSYIAGLKSVVIEQKDLLQDFGLQGSVKKFDKIYGHFPFGMKTRTQEISPIFPSSSRNADVLFLDVVVSSLADEGRAAVIVTDSILSSTPKGYLNVRKKIVEEMHVEAVISLPVKLHNTNIPTYLLIFKNEVSSYDILFMDLNSSDNTKKDKKISKKSLKEAIAFFHEYKDSGYDSESCIKKQESKHLKSDIWFVSKERIIENDYRLALQLYKPHLAAAEVFPIDNILDVMKKQLSEIIIEIDELKESVSKINEITSDAFEVKKLEEICKIKSGRPLPNNVDHEEGTLPWVQIRDMTKSNDFLLLDAEKKISKEFAVKHNLTIVKKNTVLLSIRGTIGTTAIAGSTMCIGPNVAALEIIDNQINPWFLMGLFLKNKEGMENQTYGTIPMISISMLKNMEVALPNLSDQGYIEEYEKAMKRLRYIKVLSENNYNQIDKMANSLFNQYFMPSDLDFKKLLGLSVVGAAVAGPIGAGLGSLLGLGLSTLTKSKKDK